MSKPVVDAMVVVCRDVDVMSYAQYPKVFQQYQEFYKDFDDVSVLDTRTFLEGLKLGTSHSTRFNHNGRIVDWTLVPMVTTRN